MILQNQGNAVRPAAQAATWSGGPDGIASGCQGRLVAAGLSDARVQGKESLATLGSCLKNPAVDLANVPANRQRTPKVIPTLLAMPLAGTFASHRSRYAAAHTSQIRHLMKKTPTGQFLLGALALSLAALFTACQSTPTQTAAGLKRLQGYWGGDGAAGKCSITITGNSLHFYVRTDFWYETTFTLPAGTYPQQLHATIKDCSPPTTNAIGKVVFAICKIEDGTLTLAEDDMSNKPPKIFSSASSLYVLKRVQPQKKNTEPPKTK